MKWVSLVLIVALVYFQHYIWYAKGGYHDMHRLQQQVAVQYEENKALAVRNTALAEEVGDLADGKEAIAEIARVDLGYIESGETFYRVVEPVVR